MGKKQIFDIIRKQSEIAKVEIHNIKKVKKSKKLPVMIREHSETKNIVLNFRSVFKKILQDEMEKFSLDVEQINKIKSLITQMESKTNIAMIRSLLQDTWFRSVMIEMERIHQIGLFQKLILQSNMLLQNKFYCLKYLNCLLNGFEMPETLNKWVPFKSSQIEKPKRSYNKICILSNNYQQNMTTEATDNTSRDSQDDIQEKYDFFHQPQLGMAQYDLNHREIEMNGPSLFN